MGLGWELCSWIINYVITQRWAIYVWVAEDARYAQTQRVAFYKHTIVSHSVGKNVLILKEFT